MIIARSCDSKGQIDQLVAVIRCLWSIVTLNGGGWVVSLALTLIDEAGQV